MTRRHDKGNFTGSSLLASWMTFTFALVVAVATTSGCTAIAERVIEKPKVNIDKVSVKDVTGGAATVVFAVKVDNPNPFALTVDALKYDVEIGGKPLGSGRLEQGAKVAAKSSTVVEVPVPVKFLDLFASVLDFLQSGTSSYRLKGEATMGLLTIPFDQKGDFKLRN